MIFKRKNIWLFIFIDSFVIGLSLIGSYLLRFDFVIPKEFIPGATYFFVVLLFSKLAVNVVLNVYSGLWRYTSFNDLLNILKASTAGTVLSAALSLMVLGLFVIPRSIFFIDYILTTIGFISTRAAVRFYSNFLLRKEKKSNQVYDDSFAGRLSGGDNPQTATKDYIESADSLSDSIFDYDAYGSDDDVYGDYG